MKPLFTTLLILITVITTAQTEVSGKVTDNHGVPIPGANVYLDGTYDGATTDENGLFSFTTDATGNQTLVVSFIAFETHRYSAAVATMHGLSIILQEEINTLTGVTLTAGTFEAGDNAKAAVLKPLDVVTTAGAMGDFVGALQTLPGTTTVAEDGRLFVRGGDADETQIFVDGIRVFSPFVPTANNTPTRGRFSPFLFNGISFSTGGYSAEYGQALSSVLLLNTINEPEQEQTNIGIMTIGGSVGNTQIWGKNSLSINASYVNLKPYREIMPDRNNWKKPYEAFGGEMVYRHKFENGILKWYGALDYTNFEIYQDDINYEDQVRFKLLNRNFYTNLSYKGTLANDWILSTGASVSYSGNQYTIINDDIDQDDLSYHAKVAFKKSFNKHIKLNTGAEYFSTNFTEKYTPENGSTFRSDAENELPAVFAETDVFFTNSLALKAGLRGSYTALSNDVMVSPRLSLAYKTGKNDQVSLAFGNFYQTPSNSYTKYAPTLKPQKATHYIANYQYNRDGRTFRAEAYYKDYESFIKYNALNPEYNTDYTNNGYGYAKGVDAFWRDNKTFETIDYWVSYSYLDTKRDYKNYEAEVMPNFAANHNLSVVTKFWIDDLKSQLGASYSFTSGRPYNNPNTTQFMSEKTKSYNNVSFSWAYLLSQQKILFFSISNPLGIKNINGYQYADTPDMDGIYQRRALRPSADTFFFVGFFWTISSDKTKNQLDNL